MPHKGDMMTVREIVETLGLAADEDAVRKMAEYNAMVIAMSRKMNLTGIKDAEESLVKNIYDSLTVYEEKYFPKNGRMLDLGTGAGFPGIPLAILRPDMQVVLVDSVLKKLVFIENAAAKLGIKNIKILHIRAEEGGRRRKTRETFDMVTARAVKMLPIIAEWGVPFVKEGGVFAAMKGPGADEELRQSGKDSEGIECGAHGAKRAGAPYGGKKDDSLLQENRAVSQNLSEKSGCGGKETDHRRSVKE